MAERTITTSPSDLWVYGIDLPRDEALEATAEPDVRWDENDEFVPWPMALALGAEHLDHDFVEPAFIDDMTMPVSEFLQGQTRADVAEKDRLDGVKGAIIMISREPGDDRLSRDPDAPFYFLGVYPVEPYSFTLGAPDEPSKSGSPKTPQSSEPNNPSRRNLVTAAVIVGIACIVMGIMQMGR